MEICFLKKILVDEKISKKIKKESDFQSYLGKKFSDAGFVYYKLSDADQLSLKPCDCFFVDNYGITHWTELKITSGGTININCLEGQQKSFLKKVSSKGGSGIIIIYSKKYSAYKIYKINDFLDSGNNEGTVNIFGEKLKDRKIKKEIINKFLENEMINNVPL